jgi:phenylacetate-CoA ligase
VTAARYYPTDLLLAVERVGAALCGPPGSAPARLLQTAKLTCLAPFFQPAPLTEALDHLLEGVCQYPWQPLMEAEEVYELSPVGTVVLDDVRAAATLRGLLFGWATGNAVVVRTERPGFWAQLADLMRADGGPLPPLRCLPPGAPAAGAVPVHVPAPVVRTDEPAPGAEAFPHPEVAAPPAEDGTPGPAAGPRDHEAQEVRWDTADPEREQRFAARVVLADARSAWPRRLMRRTLLPGTPLAHARARDAAGEEARIGARLRYLVGRARATPHYAALPRIDDRGSLGALPILTKEDLEAGSLPNSRALYSGAVPSGELMRSGGSSGAPRYVLYSREDWANMVREAVPQLYALGLAPGDRLVNTLFGGGLYGGLTTSVSELSRMTVECYTTAQLVTVDDVLTLTSPGFGANAILGQPALLLPLLRQAKDRDPRLRLEKVLYGGTPMAEADKRWLRDRLGVRVVSSILAANDGAQLGYQCPAMSGSLHHLCDDYNLIEAVDDTGTPVPDGEPGHLLVTSLQKFETPLIRYRIGDYGRIFRHRCDCGLSGRVLDYAGRSDGLIKLMGRRVLHSELLAELGTFHVSQLQVDVRSDGRRETVTLRTESPRALDPDAVRGHVLAAFSRLGADNEFDPGLGTFALAVECHAEGGLPRDPVSGKIRTVLDHRLR